MSTTRNNSLVQPYLFFGGRCEEAIDFYSKAVGAEVEMIMRHKENPQPQPPGMLAPGFENKIMHASFRIGQSIVMGSDGCGDAKMKFEGFSLAFTAPDEATAERVFGALAEGGQVEMPLTKTFWSPRFGLLADKFGIGWMIMVVPPSQPFVISRTFNAPRDLVWKAWTERDRLLEWFAPKGFKMTTAKLDLRPGGTFLYALTSPDGKQMWGKFTYREIAAPGRIVLVNSFSDEKGGITRHPMSATWPLEMLSTTTLEESQGKTTITIEWTPLNPSDAEQKTFDNAHEGMKQGWTGTFEQLDEYLAKHKK